MAPWAPKRVTERNQAPYSFLWRLTTASARRDQGHPISDPVGDYQGPLGSAVFGGPGSLAMASLARRPKMMEAPPGADAAKVLTTSFRRPSGTRSSKSAPPGRQWTCGWPKGLTSISQPFGLGNTCQKSGRTEPKEIWTNSLLLGYPYPDAIQDPTNEPRVFSEFSSPILWMSRVTWGPQINCKY